MLTASNSPASVHSQQRESVRLHSLDGLRALAVCLVVLHHLGFSSFAQSLVANGHKMAGRILGSFTSSGVELFFVLSGVVLLRPYLRHGRPMDVAQYCWRRVVRLYPPFVVAWLLSGLAVWMVWAYPTWWSHVSALPIFDFKDWISQSGIMYFGTRPHNFAWWSLTVELMFYLSAPVVITLVVSAKNPDTAVRCLFAVSLVVALLVFPEGSNVGPLAIAEVKAFAVYLSSFSAGVFLARSDLSRSLRRLVAITGLAVILCGGSIDGLNIHVGWGLFYFGVVASAMDRSTRASRSLSNDKLVWLGERSYSIFLTHYAVITITCLVVSSWVPSKGAVYFLATRVISLLVSMVVAMLVFHLVEKRFARNLATADRFLPWMPSAARPAQLNIAP